MSVVKERMTELIRAQPEDSSYDEILRELAFEQMIARGLEDSREGRTISDEEMKRKISGPSIGSDQTSLTQPPDNEDKVSYEEAP